MSDGRNRLPDPAVRFAFEQWRAKNPHGSITQFFHRERTRGGKRARLRRAQQRMNDPKLPPLTRQRAREDFERLKAEAVS